MRPAPLRVRRAIPVLATSSALALAAQAVTVARSAPSAAVEAVRSRAASAASAGAVPTPTPADADSAPAPVPSSAPAWAAAVNRTIAHHRGRAAVAFYDAATGAQWASSDASFAAASVIKLAIAEAVLLRAQHEQRAPTSHELVLARRMIATSDNDAATTLWRRLGSATGVQPLLAELGTTHTVAAEHWGLTVTTAADQVELVRRAVHRNAVLNDESRSTLRTLLRAVVPGQRWGVTRGAPRDGALVKNGWLPTTGGWVVNSAGAVSAGGKDFVVAVLSDHNRSQSSGIELVESIARVVWEWAGKS